MDEELIRACALTARAACQRMTPDHLTALRHSVEQACCLPAGFGWDRKATAHAEVVNLLADVAADPVLALLARDAPGQLHDLLVTVGPAASGIVASSRRRLLALIAAGNAEGAEREMEQHLGCLCWMRRLSRGSARGEIAVLPEPAAGGLQACRAALPIAQPTPIEQVRCAIGRSAPGGLGRIADGLGTG